MIKGLDMRTVSGTGEGETEGPGESEARDIDGSSDVRESEWSGGSGGLVSSS